MKKGLTDEGLALSYLGNVDESWEVAEEAVVSEIVETNFGTDLLPAISEKDSSSSTFTSDGLLPVTFIQSGWSRNSRIEFDKEDKPIEVFRYYTSDAIRSMEKHLGSRTAMYLDHEMPYGGPMATMDRWAAEIKKFSIVDKSGRTQAIGEVDVFSDGFTGFLKNRISEYPEKVGVSIRASARSRRGRVAGREADIIEEIAYLASVDFVRYPGIPGAGIRKKESEEKTLESGSAPIEAPIEPKLKEESKTVDLKTVAELRALNPTLLAELLKEEKAAWEAETERDEKIDALTAEVASLTAERDAARADIEKLQAEKEDLAKNEALRARKDSIAALLETSELDPKNAEHVSEKFMKILLACESDEEVAELIADRAALVSEKEAVIEGHGVPTVKKETAAPTSEPRKEKTNDEILRGLREGTGRLRRVA